MYVPNALDKIDNEALQLLFLMRSAHEKRDVSFETGLPVKIVLYVELLYRLAIDLALKTKYYSTLFSLETFQK